MPSAEIIAIGSELLLGETIDTNTSFLLKQLRNIGINIYRTQIIGDNIIRIQDAIRESLNRADIVITTGGLGPTIDDPTRAAVAGAFNQDLIYREDLWADVCAYFLQHGREPTENNKRQAYIPANAEPIRNPIGTAPSFYVMHGKKIVIALPGVPIEMKYLTETAVIPLLKEKYQHNDRIITRTLHTFGIGESIVDEIVADLETWSNPTLGLSAKEGVTNLRLTAKGSDREDAAAKISDLEKLIRKRLGVKIYGVDDETLPNILNHELAKRNIKLRVVEIGTNGKIAAEITPENLSTGSILLTDDEEDVFTRILIESENKIAPSDLCNLFVLRKTVEEGFYQVQLTSKISSESRTETRKYNPQLFSDQFFVYFALEAVRLLLIDRD